MVRPLPEHGDYGLTLLGDTCLQARTLWLLRIHVFVCRKISISVLSSGIAANSFASISIPFHYCKQIGFINGLSICVRRDVFKIAPKLLEK